MPLHKKYGLRLDSHTWRLPDARAAAARVLAVPDLIKPLLRALASDNPLLRQRAADTARRVTETQPALLVPHADQLLDLFSESANDNWRTRTHLGLVVARTAKSASQKRRAAGLLMPLYYDPSNVVRCTAIEDLGMLARADTTLRAQFVTIAEEALTTGTLAMQNRAHHALTRLSRPS